MRWILLLICACARLLAAEPATPAPAAPAATTEAEIDAFLSAVRNDDPATFKAFLADHPAMAKTAVLVIKRPYKLPAHWMPVITYYRAGDTGKPGIPGFTLTADSANPQTLSNVILIPLLVAVRFNRMDLLPLLLDAGADIRQRDSDGHDVLYHAIAWGAWRMQPTAMIELLIARGADPNQRYPSGKTPLHWAMASGEPHREELLECLLKAGAQVDAVDNEGNTPLHCAFTDRDEFVLYKVQLLVEHGADINHANMNGRTPLMFLAENGGRSNETVAWMVAHGADPTLRDHDGRTACDILFDDGWLYSLDTIAALHPVYIRIPATLQLLVYVGLLIAAGAWVRRYARQAPALAEAAWAQELRLHTGWQQDLPANQVQQLPDHLNRWQRHARRLRWTLWTLIASVGLTLLTLCDPMMPSMETIYFQVGYVLLLALGYALLHIRARWSTLVLLLLGAAYAGVGVYCLGAIGWIMLKLGITVWLATVYAVAGLVFVFQTGLFGLLAWQRWRLLRFESGLKRASNRILKDRENTGIEAGANWDQAHRD